MRKKILPIFLAFIIFVSSFFMQVEKAQAVTGVEEAVAIGGVAYSAAAIYVGVGLLVAAGAGVLGIEYADEIKAHSTNVWNSLNETAKSAWNVAVEQSIKTGKSTVALSQELADAWNEAFAGTGEWLNNLIAQKVEPIPDNIEDLTNEMVAFSFSNYTSTVSNEDAVFRINGIDYRRIAYQHGTNGIVYAWLVGNSSATYSKKIGLVATAEIDTFLNWDAYLRSNGINITYNVTGTRDIPTTSEFDTYINDNIDVLTGIKEINLALDQWLYKDTAGNIVNWDTAADVWTYPNGNVYEGEVSVTTPFPTVGEVVPTFSNPSVPIESLTVGNTPMVQNPPSNPPVEKGRIDWSKLTMALGALRTVFPFSIPWDVAQLLGVFNVQPKAPVFNFNIDKTVKIGFATIPIKYKFDVDFSTFDPVAAVGRWGLILVFDISIILALRRLTPD